MNKELRDEWVAALRSGKYEQGQDQLKTSAGEYCCLGVLCEVLGVDLERANVNGVKVGEATGTETAALGGDPLELVRALHYKTRSRLAKLNDNGASFEELAGVIEKTVRVKP